LASGGQLAQYRVDENLTAHFETPPRDVLRGINELKRVEDGLKVELGVTPDTLTLERAAT
jgi:hypothetical protein